MTASWSASFNILSCAPQRYHCQTPRPSRRRAEQASPFQVPKAGFIVTLRPCTGETSVDPRFVSALSTLRPLRRDSFPWSHRSRVIYPILSDTRRTKTRISFCGFWVAAAHRHLRSWPTTPIPTRCLLPRLLLQRPARNSSNQIRWRTLQCDHSTLRAANTTSPSMRLLKVPGSYASMSSRACPHLHPRDHHRLQLLCRT